MCATPDLDREEDRGTGRGEEEGGEDPCRGRSWPVRRQSGRARVAVIGHEANADGGGGSWFAAPSCRGAAKDVAGGSHGGGGDEGRGRALAKDADEMAASQLPWPG